MKKATWIAGLFAALTISGCGGEGSDTQDGATGGAAGAAGSGATGAGAGGAGGVAGAASGGAAGSSGGAAKDAGAADAPAADGAGCALGAPRFVTGAIAHAFGPGQSIGQATFPQPILGPPKGGGCCQGSLDVVSLGDGGSVTVEFAGNAIVDGPGADFIVFENAFWIGGDETQPFAELATVEVSADGSTWVAFPCSATKAPYGSCAGWHPVFANADENTVEPLDPAVAGGDAFDLSDVGLSMARYVRITDRADLSGPAGVFDLDAVGIVNALCP